MIKVTMTNGCIKVYENDSIVKTPQGDKPTGYLVPGAQVLAFDNSVMIISIVEVN